MQYRWVFLHVVCILTHPMGSSKKKAQFVKILSNTTHQKKMSQKIYVLYGKIVLRWIQAFWLDPTQSEFCNTNCFYGNSHTLCIFGHKSWQIQNKQVWSECHIINFLLILPGTIKILWSNIYLSKHLCHGKKKTMIKIKECISKGTYHQNKGTSRNKNSQN